MKKYFKTVIIAMLCLVVVACTGKNNMTLAGYVDVYKGLGYEVDINEKPYYSMIEAIDGVIFYIDDQKVAIYEYKSESALNSANFDFDAKNGRFGIETSNDTAEKIFLNPAEFSDEKIKDISKTDDEAESDIENDTTNKVEEENDEKYSNLIVEILHMSYDDVIAKFGNEYEESEYSGGYMLDYRNSDYKMMIGFPIINFSNESIASVLYRYDIKEFASVVNIEGDVLPSEILEIFGVPDYKGYDEMGEIGYMITYDVTGNEKLGYVYTFISPDEYSEITAIEYRLK